MKRHILPLGDFCCTQIDNYIRNIYNSCFRPTAVRPRKKHWEKRDNRVMSSISEKILQIIKSTHNVK